LVRCPDPGLLAYDSLEEKTSFRVLIWIGVFLALEQMVHAFFLFFSCRRMTFNLKVRPSFQLPTSLTLAWVVFTSLSIITVALTWRSDASILAKSIHVGVEAAFLSLLAHRFGLTWISALSSFLVLFVLAFSLTTECESTVTLAASSGLVLDAINFLAFAIYGLTERTNFVLWHLIIGFGWHALYLLTFIGVLRWDMSDDWRIGFRASGMVFNLVASEFLLLAVRRVLFRRESILRVEDWREREEDKAEGEEREEEKTLVVWTGSGPRFSKPPFGKLIFCFEPEFSSLSLSSFSIYTAAYVSFSSLFPFFGSVLLSRKREDPEKVVLHSSFLCGLFCRKEYDLSLLTNVPYNETVLLIKWWHVRTIYALVAILLGIAFSIPE
jgi:hypothetical protein